MLLLQPSSPFFSRRVEKRSEPQRRPITLGWLISIYTQRKGGASPASFGEEAAARLAVWQTGLGGLDWVDEPVKQGSPISLGGDGYPTKYTAQIKQVRPIVLDRPPGARLHWGFDEGDILTELWCGKTTIDRDALDSCGSDEWILIRAWDES